MLGVVLGTGLADPAIGLGGVLVQGPPRAQHLVPGGDGLCPDVGERDIVHRLVEHLVHGVDVDLTRPVSAEPDLLENGTGFGEPAPDVRDEILRRPALGEVPRLRNLVLGK